MRLMMHGVYSLKLKVDWDWDWVRLQKCCSKCNIQY